MDARCFKLCSTRGLPLLVWGLLWAEPVCAQELDQPATGAQSVWQGYDWLGSPQNPQQTPIASGETVKASGGQDIHDPFAVLASGALWQDKYGAVDTRPLGDGLTLSAEGSDIAFDEDSDDLSRSQKLGLQFQPVQELSLGGDFRDATSDAPMAGESTTATGADLNVESHLPTNTVLTLGFHSDESSVDGVAGDTTQTNAYDAQLQQPLGKLPLTAVLKGHYEGTSEDGAAPTSLPSLEQSLVWKPIGDTTFQAGLRQQQYQEYPGVDHLLNEALFADWSQKVLDSVTWHSYAEVLNSRGLLDQAPAAPIASGANGTAQATVPGSNASLTSSLPISVDDQTLTFTTGPSFQLQKDISASLEYSDRWDKNPAAGAMGEEQRVSVSLKGTF